MNERERIEQIERDLAVMQERVHNILESLNGIKSTLDKVDDKLENLKSLPGKYMWAILLPLVTSALLAVFRLL